MGGRGASLHGGITRAEIRSAVKTYQAVRRNTLVYAEMARSSARKGLSTKTNNRNVEREIIRQNVGQLRQMRKNISSLRKEYSTKERSLFGMSVTRRTLSTGRTRGQAKGYDLAAGLRNRVRAERSKRALSIRARRIEKGLNKRALRGEDISAEVAKAKSLRERAARIKV